MVSKGIMLLKWYEIRDDDPVFTITLSPSEIRYVRAEDLFNADVESLIAQIRQLSPYPIIEDPYYSVTERKQRNDYGEVTEEIHWPTDFSKLFAREVWDVQLRLHHAFGQMSKSEGMTTEVYYLFHSHLCLGRQFAFAECLESWVKGTEKGQKFREPHKASPEHIEVLTKRYIGDTGGCVYRKTDFVKEKLKSVEEQKAKADLEMLNNEILKKSRFDSFVYLMEDRRNNTVKIGRSKTPHKREYTLQSEVPEIVLRFAIPADEDDERNLHGRFVGKWQRGEWFSLTADELLWIVWFLKKRGDVPRASVDYDWLGRITMQASAKGE